MQKRIIGYGLIILVGYFLFSAAWGAAGGVLVVGKMVRDPIFMNKIKKEIGDKPPKDGAGYWANLPEEKKAALLRIVEEQMKKVNWLPVHLIANFVTFTLLGLAVGIFLKEYRYSGIIPLALLPATLLTLGSSRFANDSRFLTITFGIAVQFSSVYAFSYLGFRARKSGGGDSVTSG